MTTKSTGRVDVIGSVHFFTIFGAPLAVCCIATMTRLAPVTKSMAPPMPGTILLGDHPVGQPSLLIDLQAAEHREVEMTAANEAERHGAVERAGAGQCRDRTAARVGQRGMRHAFFGRRAGADQSILGLEENMHAVRQIVRDQRRNPDAEIDEHARSKLPGNPTRDDGLRFHSALMQLATR